MTILQNEEEAGWKHVYIQRMRDMGVSRDETLSWKNPRSTPKWTLNVDTPR